METKDGCLLVLCKQNSVIPGLALHMESGFLEILMELVPRLLLGVYE